MKILPTLALAGMLLGCAKPVDHSAAIDHIFKHRYACRQTALDCFMLRDNKRYQAALLRCERKFHDDLVVEWARK